MFGVWMPNNLKYNIIKSNARALSEKKVLRLNYLPVLNKYNIINISIKTDLPLRIHGKPGMVNHVSIYWY